MPRTRLAITVGDWAELAQRVTPETTEGLANLEHVRSKLQGSLEEINRLILERDFHEARKQEVTLRINEILEEGRRQATLVRAILREELDPTSEKLAAFGMQPFRGRKRAPKSPKTPSAT